MTKKLVYTTAGEPMAELPTMPVLAPVRVTPSAKVSVTLLHEATGGPIVVLVVLLERALRRQRPDPVRVTTASSSELLMPPPTICTVASQVPVAIPFLSLGLSNVCMFLDEFRRSWLLGKSYLSGCHHGARTMYSSRRGYQLLW